jgi:prepilin-type N-terminal cleavage/methylation domain-containing protein
MRRAGYTLFELILVMAILATLAMLAVPFFDTMSGSMRLTESADQIRAALAQARAHAIAEGRAYRFSYVPGKGNYRVAPDAADFWSSGGQNNQGMDAGATTAPPYIQDDALPKGVRLAAAEGTPQASNNQNSGGSNGDSALPVGSVSPGMWVTGSVFQPDGSAQDLDMVFSSRGNRPLTLRLRGMTGSVTVRRQAVKK